MYVIPFIAFFGVVLGTMVTQYQIRRRMIDHHPDEWISVARKSNLFYRAEYYYPYSGQHRDLADQRLTRLVMRYRWLNGAGVVAWLAFVGGILLETSSR